MDMIYYICENKHVLPCFSTWKLPKVIPCPQCGKPMWWTFDFKQGLSRRMPWDP